MKICVKKKCKHKGKLQSSSEFYQNTQMRDGLDCYCKTCRKEAANKIHKNNRGTNWYNIVIG